MPSGAVTVGSLVINMSANTGQLKSDMADASASVQSTSQSMVNAWAGVAAASDNATSAGARLVAQLNDEIATFGMSSQELTQYKANLNGVGAEVAALQSRLEQMRSSQASFSSQSAASDAAATTRIREMVAASMAEVAATEQLAASTRNTTNAQEVATNTGLRFADSQRLQVLNMQGVAAAMKSTQAGTAALSTETQRILDRYDPLGTKLRSLQAEFATLRKEMGNSVDPAAMKAFQGLEDEISKTQALMAKAGVDGFGKLEDGAKKGAFATAGATRELIVLGHEVISGNFSRMPGSFMVLAERMSFTSALFSPMTLGFVGLGAAAIAVGVAITQGHDQMVAMDNALLVTSNYAGMSRQNMELLAVSMTQSKELTIGSANAIVLALTSSGKIGGEAIGNIAHFISDFAKSTGQSVDEIAPKMISLFEDPIKGAQELNSTMHFLTTTQIEHIAALERTGQAQKAQDELAKAAADHMPKQAQNMGVVTKALLEQRDAWTKLWQAIMNAGAENTTPSQKAQDLRDDISDLMSRGLTRKDPHVVAAQAKLDALEPLLAKQKELTQAEKDSAAANELQAKSWDAVKASSTAYHIQELQDKLKLIELHKSEAGPNFNEEESAKRDAIRKTNDEIEAAQRSIGAEGRQLTQQQLASDEAISQVKLKAFADDTTALYKLGMISKDEFDRRILNTTLEENLSKQNYEQRMSRVAGLTDAERQSHQQKLTLLQAEYDAAESKGVNAQNIADKAVYDGIAKAVIDAGVASIHSLDQQIAKQKEHNAEIGKTAAQIELAKQAAEDLGTAQLQSDADFIRDGLTKWKLDDQARAIYVIRLADLDAEIAKRHTLSGLLVQGSDLEAGAKAAQELDKFLDPTKAHAFGDSLKEAFGTAGESISKMTSLLQTFGAKQAAIDKERGNAALAYLTGKKTEAEYLAANDELNRRAAQNQVAEYAGMADAAQGFFDQGSKGYAAMHAASQVLHTAEVALSLVKGVNAVLTQGEGDPYSAFARMAAMSALVVGLGVALSGGGGGGGQSAADVQKTQGTGTVFGDLTAKSDSIAHSVALAAANSSIELTHTAGMLTALQGIQSSMAGLANLVVRTTGMTDASNMNIQTGTLSSGLIGGVIGQITHSALGLLISPVLSLLNNLWGKTTQNVVDNGFQFGGNVKSLEAGQGFNQYASVDTTKSSWFGLSKSTSNSVQTQGISNDLSSQFGLVFSNLEASLKASAVGLGLSADQVGHTLDNLTLATQKISLKGLTGDALTSAINGVMSNAMDQMAKAALPGYEQFQKVGEGYAETVTRVSTDFQNVGSIFESMGKSLVTTSSTTGTLLSGWFGRLAEGITDNVGSSLATVSTLSVAARERLIDLAGGLNNMASQANAFSTNFLSKAEQLAPVTKYVTDQMAALGYASVTTRDQFKDLVLGLDVSTQAGAEQYTALMNLQNAFAQTHAATVDLTKTEQEIADERKGLQDQLDTLTMTQTQLLTKQRNALDAANRPLFDMVQAAQTLANTSTNMAKFRDAAQSLHDGLLTGNLSTLTPEQQYAQLRTQYEQTKSAALGGDVTAQGNVSNALTAFLTASQKINGGDSQYAADFNMGQQDSAGMAQWAAGQVDSAQAQLNAMNSANAILTTIAQGITNLPGALSNTPINPANYGGADGMTVLVAQVKQMTSTITNLQSEVAGLRADNQKLTGAGMVANDKSNQDNATAIVTGVSVAIGRAVGAQKVALE